MDLPTETRPLPVLFTAALSVAVGVAWLSVLTVLVAMVLAPGLGNPISALFPSHLDGAVQVALALQYGLTVATILTILGFGTVALVHLANGAERKAVSVARLLLRVLIGVTAASWLVQIAMPLAVSGEILTTLSALVVTLPTTAVQIAFLVLADRYLSPHEADIF